MSSSAPRIIPEHCSTQTAHRVSVADTDMMGIVHHANYVLLFERGRLEYLRRRGLPYKDMVGRGLHMPVVELNVRYRKPAQFDDRLVIHARVGELRGARFRFEYEVKRDGELLADGWTSHACVDATTFRPTRIPQALADSIARAEAL